MIHIASRAIITNGLRGPRKIMFRKSPSVVRLKDVEGGVDRDVACGVFRLISLF